MGPLYLYLSLSKLMGWTIWDLTANRSKRFYLPTNVQNALGPLGPTKPPIQLVAAALFPGGKVARSRSQPPMFI